jgi:UDP-3-O-[3-hydroxymyristoyl] glucosamine N-acyltransferase
MKLAEIAAKIGGELIGNGEIAISGVNSAERAREQELTFAENSKYFAAAEKSPAAAVIVSENVAGTTKALVRVANVRAALARALAIFFPPEQPAAGIHSSAVIHPTAVVEASASIGPHCVIGAGARVGARTVLLGGNHIGRDCVVGEGVWLYPNVVLYARTQVGDRVVIHAGTVIGSDGYGYVFDGGRHAKLLQLGNVEIGPDVEIGSNASIDRAAFGSTRIGAGTKIDNLVHVAHNVVFGKHCLIMGQCGFAGSTELGDYAVIASQSGIAGHLKLGRQATVGAKSGVMRDVADGETVLGIPAMPHKQTKRQWVAQQQLPEILRRMRELEEQVRALQSATVPGT